MINLDQSNFLLHGMYAPLFNFMTSVRNRSQHDEKKKLSSVTMNAVNQLRIQILNNFRFVSYPGPSQSLKSQSNRCAKICVI